MGKEYLKKIFISGVYMRGWLWIMSPHYSVPLYTVTLKKDFVFNLQLFVKSAKKFRIDGPIIL